MSNGFADAGAAREQLSALADGELSSPSAVIAACAAWKDDATVRATWHGYQLIGDVLRSEDLASAPARDAAFLQTLRARLAAEPVVLAPAALEQPAASADDASSAGFGGRRVGRGSNRWWAMPAAVAAGFMAVAAVLLVARTPLPGAGTERQIASVDNSSAAANPLVATAAGGQSLAGAISAPALAEPTAPLVAFDAPATPAETFVTHHRVMVRDPQLDRYLVAHRQFAGSTALGMPAGFLRNASAEVPGR